MTFALKDNQKRTQFIRTFYYKNLHKIPVIVENVSLFYTINKDISIKPLIKLSALLELVTNQRPLLLRANKSSITSKIRKGSPVGVLVSLRGFNFQTFFSHLVWEILPHIKNVQVKTNKQKISFSSTQSCFLFTVGDPLIFPFTKKFYTSFKNCLDLRCVISFGKKSTTAENLLNRRYILLPF